MKTSAKTVLSVAMILPMVFASTAWAQRSDTPASENPELKKRLEDRKNNLQTRLTSFQQQQVKLQCKAAQGKIKVVQGRLNGTSAQRGTRYTNALDRLTNLSAKLKVNEVDVATLDSQITELKAMVDGYTSGYAEFKLQIDDLVNMDCESDPEAFKATLLEAREKRTMLVQTADDIKNFLATKIKPTLLTVRQAVAENQDNSDAGGEG